VIISSITEMLEFQRHRLILWGPVVFGAGIVIYFALKTEPSTMQIWLGAGIGLSCVPFIRPRLIIRTVILFTILLTSLGYSYAAYRTITFKTPVLERHYYGPVYGRIIGLDRSATNAPRVLLDRLYIPGITAAKTPKRVRISLHGMIPDNTLIAGSRVALTTSVSPPSPPVEPGGFDFRRMAWFMSLGGVGYTRNPIIPAYDDAEPDFRARLFSVRMAVSAIVKRSIEGQNGAFAAAIITGDRSDIDPEILDSLRASNLAHLLAISGLHMGLLSGFVFTLLRYGFAIAPYFALRIRPKKIAAALAILAGAAYLMLSGVSVATQRAFIMTTVVLLAVILDKPAFTLRAVALAAFIVLLIKPYSVLEAGYQMSFAATTALISAYEFLNRRDVWKRLSYGKWKYAKPVLALMFTSAVAGVATAPISAFHFNQISQYGLAANLLAVPVMGSLVMPSAVFAFLLIPLGLEDLAFWVMGKGIGYILWVATYFSGLDGALTHIKSAPAFVLGGISIGGLILLLWQGKGRAVGVLVIFMSIFVWSKSSRPLVLIDSSGKVFGLQTEAGRVVNKPRGSGYAVKIWLENDGDPTSQAEAFERDGIDSGKRDAGADIGQTWRVYLYSGDDVRIVNSECRQRTILILSKLDYASEICTVIDPNYLRRSGAVAVNMKNGTPVFDHSRGAAKNRPWGY